MPFAATWKDLEIIILNEVTQEEKDEYHMISHVELKRKKLQINLLQNRNRLTDIGNQFKDTKGEM